MVFILFTFEAGTFKNVEEKNRLCELFDFGKVSPIFFCVGGTMILFFHKMADKSLNSSGVQTIENDKWSFNFDVPNFVSIWTIS